MNSEPHFCWACGSMLQRKPGGGYYRATKVIEGHERVLHIFCKERYEKEHPTETPHLFLPDVRRDAEQS